MERRSTATRERPDPRPARLMMGATALAAVTVIGAGLVDLPSATAGDPVITGTGADSGATSTAPQTKKVKQPVTYVRLKPGQKAPKGAKVIKEAAPTPRVIVRQVVRPAAAGSTRQTTRPAARTRQSGG